MKAFFLINCIFKGVLLKKYDFYQKIIKNEAQFNENTIFLNFYQKKISIR